MGRRHAVTVALAVALMLFALLALAISTVLIWKEQTRTQRAYQAEARLRQKARKAVDEMYGQVAQQLLTEKPDMEKVRRDFLEKALALYRDFAVEHEADPVAGLEAVAASRTSATSNDRWGTTRRPRRLTVKSSPSSTIW